MAAPRVLVLRAPGTNCDLETADAFERAGAHAERIHVNRLLENPALPDRYQILCLPGGFSYGDDIAAGRILAVRLRQQLGAMISAFTGGDRLVLGICNGMQVLMRMGLLTGDLDRNADDDRPRTAATLTWNHSGRFVDRWVHLKTDPKTDCVFLRDVSSMYLPIAHAEGRFVMADPSVRDRLSSDGRLAMRYVASEDAGIEDDRLPPPANPNGADSNVAGVCDASGKIFGLMPHPERHIDATHHPRWTRREEQPSEGDGMKIFRNAVQFFE